MDNLNPIIKATKEGKLYVKPSDLFTNASVQQLVKKMTAYPLVKPQAKGK